MIGFFITDTRLANPAARLLRWPVNAPNLIYPKRYLCGWTLTETACTVHATVGYSNLQRHPSFGVVFELLHMHPSDEVLESSSAANGPKPLA